MLQQAIDTRRADLSQALTGQMGLAAEARKPDWRWAAAIAAALTFILVVNPIGFVGGGWDDWQYLNAARCWAERGPCLPHDHWQGRWPIIAPLSAVIALLGENRFTVGLPSLAYAIGCLALITWLGNRLAGRPVGYLAALLLLLGSPIFAVELLDPNVEMPELFFLLSSACFLLAYKDRHNAWLALGAGLAWSLAFQVRETSAAMVPLGLLSAWLLARRDRKAWLLAIGGAALPLLIEALTFWLATGDPLWRRHLSVGHTQIASTELLGPIDHAGSPFFNPNYIAHWRHEPGIHLHWAIDGLLNLFANTKAGLIIPLSATLFILLRRQLDPRHRAIVAWCIGLSLYWACFLIYALAIDPKPRMMFVPIALAALALAVLVRDRFAKGSVALGATIVTIATVVGLAIVVVHPSLRLAEPTIQQWLDRNGDRIEADITTRRHLALIPSADRVARLDSGRPLLLLRVDMSCARWADRHFPTKLVVVGQAPMSPIETINPDLASHFCLYRYRARITPKDISRLT